ncbi:hypothetical protein TNCV_3862061 [Trichonephila clavipes]|nr:hypothetical protein TNCV_3862061 [Trichonephila clavipes]
MADLLPRNRVVPNTTSQRGDTSQVLSSMRSPSCCGLMRTRPCVCPLRFQFLECPGTGFKSFHWGRKAGKYGVQETEFGGMRLSYPTSEGEP